MSCSSRAIRTRSWAVTAAIWASRSCSSRVARLTASAALAERCRMTDPTDQGPPRKTSAAATSLGSSPSRAIAARNGTASSASPNQLFGGSSSAPIVNETSTSASSVENSPSGLIAMLLAITIAPTSSGARRRHARSAIAGTASSTCRTGACTVSLVTASATVPATNTPASSVSPSGGVTPASRLRRAAAGVITEEVTKPR
jgi:hypothetical protein